MYTDASTTADLTGIRALEQELCSDGLGGSALRRVASLDAAYSPEGDHSAFDKLPVLAGTVIA
jgi:hypothetical protein